MLTRGDIIQIIVAVASVVALVFVMRWRKRSYAHFIDDFADQEICQHLGPALDCLKDRGHRVVKAGQVNPEMPLEIHITPPFDPAQLARDLKLEEPVFVSERNVLCCREDQCELHPVV